MKRRIRIWLDELTGLPEYSLTVPTGQCHGKAWKRRVPPFGELQQWLVGMYWVCNDTMYTCFFGVDLLSGPRKGNEKSRFKVECAKGELR